GRAGGPHRAVRGDRGRGREQEAGAEYRGRFGLAAGPAAVRRGGDGRGAAAGAVQEGGVFRHGRARGRALRNLARGREGGGPAAAGDRGDVAAALAGARVRRRPDRNQRRAVRDRGG